MKLIEILMAPVMVALWLGIFFLAWVNGELE